MNLAILHGFFGFFRVQKAKKAQQYCLIRCNLQRFSQYCLAFLAFLAFGCQILMFEVVLGPTQNTRFPHPKAKKTKKNKQYCENHGKLQRIRQYCLVFFAFLTREKPKKPSNIAKVITIYDDFRNIACFFLVFVGFWVSDSYVLGWSRGSGSDPPKTQVRESLQQPIQNPYRSPDDIPLYILLETLQTPYCSIHVNSF